MPDNSVWKRALLLPLWLWQEFRAQRLQRRLGDIPDSDLERAVGKLQRLGEPGLTALHFELEFGSLSSSRFDRIADMLTAAGDEGIVPILISRYKFSLQICGPDSIRQLKRLACFRDSRVTAVLEEALVPFRDRQRLNRTAAKLLQARGYRPDAPRKQIFFLRALGRLDKLPRFGFALLEAWELSEVEGEAEAYFQLLANLHWSSALEKDREHALDLLLAHGRRLPPDLKRRLLEQTHCQRTLASIAPFVENPLHRDKCCWEYARRLDTATLRSGLAEGDVRVRRVVAELLAGRDDPESITPLGLALEGEDEKVASWAVVGLLKRQGKVDLDLLVERLFRGSHPHSAKAAIVTLASIQTPRAIVWTPRAVALLEEVLPDSGLRQGDAVEVLVRIGDSTATQILMRALWRLGHSCQGGEATHDLANSFVRVRDGLEQILRKRAEAFSDADLSQLVNAPAVVYKKIHTHIEERTTRVEVSKYETVERESCPRLVQLARVELARRSK